VLIACIMLLNHASAIAQNSRGGYGAARINSKGYHGDEKPDPRLERELFQKEGHQQTGINFAKVSLLSLQTLCNCNVVLSNIGITA
jgi:hypothetical protein